VIAIASLGLVACNAPLPRKANAAAPSAPPPASPPMAPLDSPSGVDSDRDGVPDEEDECPTVPGAAAPSTHLGCPSSRCVDLCAGKKGCVKVFGSVSFAEGSSQLGRNDSTQLREIARGLDSAREAKVIAVVGHAGDAPDAASRLALANARAANVRGWLVEHGADPNRLVTRNDSEEKSSSVDFLVVDPDQAGCCFSPCI
jgi:OOP family OmpA-OmpF porin